MIDDLTFPWGRLKGGIAQFVGKTSSIWASSNDKGFIENDLPTSSLCRFVGMETPEYTVTNWANDGESIRHDASGRLSSDTQDLGLVIYHTPGHTPDELAIWDVTERTIFVGDSLYEWADIIFPIDGNLHDYAATLSKLQALVKGWNQDAPTETRVKMACGHTTSGADAEEFLHEVERFFSKVRRGLVEPEDRGEVRGYKVVAFQREDGRISFLGPKQLFDDVRVDQCPV